MVDLEKMLLSSIQSHMDVFQAIRAQLLPTVIETGRLMSDVLKGGHKLMIAGNGGSAADSQHFAAEIVGRYLKERNPLPAIALTTDTSILTAVGNDYGFDAIFSRQVAGLGKPGDVFIGISTSGQSGNVIAAMNAAKQLGITTVTLLGKSGGKMADLGDFNLIVPSRETPRIQEAHHWIYHTWCEIIDELSE